MFEFRSLLDRYWIPRQSEKELYYAVRRALPEHRRLLNEQLGWNLIDNEAVIKLEKVPPKAMPWMGIQEFQDTMDYCILCAVLLYLSDLDDGEEFLLSSLTEAAEAFLAEECPVDWTRYAHRRALVRVLRYAQETGMLLVYDGNSDNFGNDQNQEVLYENTGLSRYFVVHFAQSIADCQTVEDFEALSRGGADTAPGRLRVQRIYRQLALCPALYWSEEERGDYDYLKNQYARIEDNLHRATGGELHVHKNGAFFVLEETGRFGEVHPGGRDLSDVVLLLCARLREAVLRGDYEPGWDDRVRLTEREFRYELSRCRAESMAGWGKNLRELAPDALFREVKAYMSSWMLLEEDGDSLLLEPAVGKWIGHYPAVWWDKHREEASDEPLENA